MAIVECTSADQVIENARAVRARMRSLQPRRTPVVEQATPEPVAELPPQPEKISVEAATDEKISIEKRFAALERRLSKLMHMVGAEESNGAIVGPTYVTAADIKRLVSEHYGVTVGELIGPSRYSKVVLPRQVAFYLCRKFTMLSLPKVGSLFNRDHTSVLHGAKMIAERRAADSVLDCDLVKFELCVTEILERRREALERDG